MKKSPICLLPILAITHSTTTVQTPFPAASRDCNSSIP